MKKSIIIAGCAVFTMGLAGCGANNNAADNNRDQQVEISQVRRGPATEGNRLQLADRAERQVEQMPEVDDARVIISENNAYVAVRLADSENDGNAEINGALDGNGRTFADNGRVDQDDSRAGNDGVIDGHGDAGDEKRQNAGKGDRGNNNIFGTGNGTGTDAGADRNSALGNGLERQIKQKVRESHRGIDNVYVSVDNNAFDRMGTFADDIRNNRNRDGLFDDFRNTMGNFFGR
ncbi:hypothetical protein G3A_14690 [Bacillus sp. 17376]|nr:hypothetical protein G3A_14690 [Bacillus sp. 17376]